MKRLVLVAVVLSVAILSDGCFSPEYGGFAFRSGEYYQETKSGRTFGPALATASFPIDLLAPVSLLADICVINPVWDTLMLPVDACFSQHGSYVRVVDEAGAPVANAEVSVLGRYEQWVLPSNVKDCALTDAEGFAYISRRKANYAVTDVQVVAEGYPRIHRIFSENNGLADDDGRKVLTIALSRPRRPTALPRQSLYVDFDSVEDEIGYDLLKQDCMPPWGRGERADVVFSIEAVTNKDCISYPLVIRSVGADDGFKVCRLTPGMVRDTFCTEREAPDAADYQPQVRTAEEVESYFAFRVRTEKDASGRVVSAYYGALVPRFDGGHRLEVITNPNPNDRSLEPAEN